MASLTSALHSVFAAHDEAPNLRDRRRGVSCSLLNNRLATPHDACVQAPVAASSTSLAAPAHEGRSDFGIWLVLLLSRYEPLPRCCLVPYHRLLAVLPHQQRVQR